MKDGEILAEIGASLPRRVMGIGVMLMLGAVVIYVALATPPANPLWRVFLLMLGGAALWVCLRMYPGDNRDRAIDGNSVAGQFRRSDCHAGRISGAWTEARLPSSRPMVSP